MSKNKSVLKKKKDNRFLQILPYLLIGIVTVVLIVLVIIVTDNEKGESDTNDGTSLVEITDPTGQGTQESTEIVVKKDEDKDILSLAERYFAAKEANDADALNDIVDSNQKYDDAELKKEGQYIESYENVATYVVPGLTANTYLAYVYYEVRFVNTTVAAPGLILMIIEENEEGVSYISANDPSAELSAYIKEVASKGEIRDLIVSVNTKLSEARKQDPALDALVEGLNSGNLVNGSETEEGTSVGTEADDETESSDEETTGESTSSEKETSSPEQSSKSE